MGVTQPYALGEVALKQLRKLSKNGVFVALICAGTAAIAACGGPSTTEATTYSQASLSSPESSAIAQGGEVRTHLDANAQIKETTRLLASEGWALGGAQVDRL